MKPGRRRLLLAATGAVLVLLALSVGLPALCRHCLEREWAQVRLGMSKSEVESVLGTPANVYCAASLQTGSFVESLVTGWLFDSFLEKWAYGRRGLFEIQRAFPFISPAFDGFLAPEDDDYVLYFSAEGRVVKKVHPYRAR
jgi:hypothetical protein